MDFNKEQLLELCKEMAKVRYLMSIHLGDNELCRDPILKRKILKMFKIYDDEDLKNRAKPTRKEDVIDYQMIFKESNKNQTLN